MERREVRRRRPPDERFLSRLHREPSGCLLWTGAVGTHGYGNFWDGERYVLAHRYAFERVNGRLPGGRRGPVVMHSCDTKLCCELTHLRRATHAANHDDCQGKDRGPQYRHRLSPAEEAVVAARCRAGETQQSLADEFGIHQTTVGRVARRVLVGA